MSRLFFLLGTLLFPPLFLVGQSTFRETYNSSDPLVSSEEFTAAERVSIHQAYYNTALANRDSLKALCGALYLVQDCLDSQDYITASKWVLVSRDLAFSSKNPVWQGWTLYKEGVLNLRLRDYEKSLALYTEAATACASGSDSLCFAESLEQASVLNALLKKFEEAETLHKQAMPLLKRHGDKTKEAKALNNLGIIFSMSGKDEEAIPYLLDAISIYREADKKLELSKTLNNLANAYQNVGKTKESEDILIDLIAFNKENKLIENLMSNYKNLSDTYRQTEDFKKSNVYLELHYDLSDSLVGIKTQNKIIELEALYKSEKQESILLAKENDLQIAENKILIRSLIIGFLVLLAFAGILFWSRNNKTKSTILENNRAALNTLVHLLKTSLNHAQNLEQKLTLIKDSSSQTNIEYEFDFTLLNESILTQDDWLQFKIQYDKAYPGYIKRLRTAYPGLSEAEERLFLFIKLKLSSKEAASMLGISIDSVKKTRNRLRKRLHLAVDVDLKAFVENF